MTPDDETAVEEHHFVPGRSTHIRLVGRFSPRVSDTSPSLPLVNNVQDLQPTIDSAGPLTNRSFLSGAAVTLNNTITPSPAIFYSLEPLEQIRQQKMLLRYQGHLTSELRSLDTETRFLRHQISWNSAHAEVTEEARFMVYSAWRCHRDIRRIVRKQKQLRRNIWLVGKDIKTMSRLMVLKLEQIEKEKEEALKQKQLQLEGRVLGTKRGGESEEEEDRRKRLRITLPKRSKDKEGG